MCPIEQGPILLGYFPQIVGKELLQLLLCLALHEFLLQIFSLKLVNALSFFSCSSVITFDCFHDESQLRRLSQSDEKIRDKFPLEAFNFFALDAI